jgi:hypothetical protein
MSTPASPLFPAGAEASATPQASAQQLRELIRQFDAQAGLGGEAVAALIEAAGQAADQLDALSLPGTQAELNVEKKTGVERIFCEALAWGMVYGPVIAREQWDGMRDRMATQYASKAAALVHGVSPLQAIPAEVLDWYRATKAHQQAVETYNARVDFVRKFCPFGTSVNEEYQMMEEARRNAGALIPAMFLALEDLLSTPAVMPQPVTGEQARAQAAKAQAVEKAIAAGGCVVPTRGDHGSPVLLYPDQLMMLLGQASGAATDGLEPGLAAAERAIREHEAAGWHGSRSHHEGLSAAANLVRDMRASAHSPSGIDTE